MPFPAPVSQVFAQYFRGWNRLEARSRRDDFAFGLKASTADPLWMLGRQWQMAELKGEDAGTPIHVQLSYETAAVDQLCLGGPEQRYQNLDATPLEVLVEREPVAWDWRLRVRVGQHFERLARAHDTEAADNLIATLRNIHCPIVIPAQNSDEWLDLDYTTRRFITLMAGRAIDGMALVAKIRGNELNGVIPQALRSQAIDSFNRSYSQPTESAPTAWHPERLDYEFWMRSRRSNAPGPICAKSYRNGSLDWETFALEAAGTGGFRRQDTYYLTPAHATFVGMPQRRWWEFEDAAVNFGDLDVAKTDLAKALLVNFALVFGDDFFVIPLRVSSNRFVRIRALVVEDCFGRKTSIPPARDASGTELDRWEVFGIAPLTGTGPGTDFLYVPPVSAMREESPILEEVRFVRDEDANVVFAIEHIVPNQMGEPVSGFAAHLEALRRSREQETAGPAIVAPNVDSDAATQLESANTSAQDTSISLPTLKYVLATSVPANWIPFIAMDQAIASGGLAQRSIKLRRAAIVSTETGDERRPIAPLTRLLKRRDGFGVEWISEEAVGRQGASVELRRQRMRTATGETYVWLGRKIAVGKGEAKSGLRFDAVQ